MTSFPTDVLDRMRATEYDYRERFGRRPARFRVSQFTYETAYAECIATMGGWLPIPERMDEPPPILTYRGIPLEKDDSVPDGDVIAEGFAPTIAELIGANIQPPA